MFVSAVFEASEVERGDSGVDSAVVVVPTSSKLVELGNELGAVAGASSLTSGVVGAVELSSTSSSPAYGVVPSVMCGCAEVLKVCPKAPPTISRPPSSSGVVVPVGTASAFVIPSHEISRPPCGAVVEEMSSFDLGLLPKPRSPVLSVFFDTISTVRFCCRCLPPVTTLRAVDAVARGSGDSEASPAEPLDGGVLGVASAVSVVLKSVILVDVGEAVDVSSEAVETVVAVI